MRWPSSPRRLALPALALGLAVAGIAVTIYLLAAHWSGSQPYCSIVEGCEVVQSSEYATIGDVPVALLGLGLYAVLAAGIAARLLGSGRAWLPTLLFTLALAGALYSAYLTYLELRVIEAVCMWCVVSAILVTVLAAVLGIDAARSGSASSADGTASVPEGPSPVQQGRRTRA